MSIGLWIIAITFGLVAVLLVAGYMDKDDDIVDIEDNDEYF